MTLWAMHTFVDQYRGGLRLLVLQPTPFCNIDCAYCYLADRSNTRRMSAATALAVLEHLHADGLIGTDLEICWHLGEPLAVGIQYYEEIIPRIAEFADGKFSPHHTFQTNGTLINDAWCAFFKRIDATVGVSLDGPPDLHDRSRVTRAGGGTFKRVLHGLEHLQRTGVMHYIIAVLGPESLECPDRIFDFFSEIGETNLCFNIEETEGIHSPSKGRVTESSLLARKFYLRFLERLHLEPDKLWIRDLQKMLGLLLTARQGECVNENNIPFRIITVAWDGEWTTYSPELISTPAPEFGNFRFGNLALEPVSHSIDREPFRIVHDEIQAGIGACRVACPYFSVCGGGAPSNKFSELGTFGGTETLACRSTVKGLADGCMDFIDTHVLQDLSSVSPPPS